MLQLKVFIIELVTIYAHAPRAVTLDEISTLKHKPLDYAVKAAALETNWFANLSVTWPHAHEVVGVSEHITHMHVALGTRMSCSSFVVLAFAAPVLSSAKLPAALMARMRQGQRVREPCGGTGDGSGAMAPEVLSCFRHSVREQLHTRVHTRK